jgi:putative CRISPR-associated protein (TIGR02619 family)
MRLEKTCTLVSTVGISLFTHLNRLLQESQVPDNDTKTKGLERKIVEKIKRHYKASNWQALGQALTDEQCDAHICGAEINSIYALSKKDWLKIWRIIFLVSDTKAGKQTGEVLTAYFESCKAKYGLQKTEYRCIKDLQDDRPWDFRTMGLRNLVKEIGNIYKEVGGSPYLIIDATGGYKAQIAVAALIGVALDIDVYYRHERFGDIISFPPLPVTLDYELIGKHGRLLHAFEESMQLTEDEIDSIDEELRVLLDQEIIDGKHCWALSPIGEIFLTGFRLRNPRPVELHNALPEEKKPPVFPRHHYPDGFQDYVRKVWGNTPWISRCVSEDYSGQAAMKKNGFELREEPGGNYVIIGTYVDHTGFAGRFKVLTTSAKRTDLVWAVDYLNQKFAGSE